MRAEFRVVENGEVGSEVEGEGMGVGDAKWVLVEDVEVTCAWWLMPFVKGKMEVAHKDVCQKVIEKVEQKRRSSAALRNDAEGLQVLDAVKRQDSKADTGEDINTGFAQETKEHYKKPQPLGFGQAHRIDPVPVEADAVDTQRSEVPSAGLPEKITYR